MNLTEFIEQLELLKHDHPDAGTLDVRVNDLDVFAVHRKHDGDREYIEIECFRPFALARES
jgi:hypothetical protein